MRNGMAGLTDSGGPGLQLRRILNHEFDLL
jgi:hypothetical protein